MKTDTVAILALAAMMGGMSSMPKRRKSPDERTQSDFDRLAAAQDKRDRKAAARRKQVRP